MDWFYQSDCRMVTHHKETPLTCLGIVRKMDVAQSVHSVVSSMPGYDTFKSEQEEAVSARQRCFRHATQQALVTVVSH